ncbi:hypothetical protein P4489_06530 [Heyndrickxia sporothermodurans]|uniref:hypothetical protein n=1 Tax=Bacillaceae TaxID=186817 RepID=UPI0028EF0861|nr:MULTISPECIES: hypothetical protein [Bacillaceae]MED3653984.1 hypothetical protein [Heyndrickxia sporothermodurans]WNS75666.1 hypothetical protein RRV45_01050 [Bacillus sp. DTU_2020_1000418_1_SI_GHA_SEK_038]
MANVAIYYQKNKEESTEQAVLHVNELIQQLETHHVIKGVFLDTFNQSIELMELLNSPLSELDYIYLNKPLENEFDNELINQLTRTEQFEIRYFNRV